LVRQHQIIVTQKKGPYQIRQKRTKTLLFKALTISFPTRIRYGTKQSMYAFVRTYCDVHAVCVRLVVEHGNRCNTCAESSETRDITCYHRRFHVERARPLVNVWRFTAPTSPKLDHLLSCFLVLPFRNHLEHPKLEYRSVTPAFSFSLVFCLINSRKTLPEPLQIRFDNREADGCFVVSVVLSRVFHR
jgi:hypothetical protein